MVFVSFGSYGGNWVTAHSTLPRVMDGANELTSSYKASGARTSQTKWKLGEGRFQDNKRQQVMMQEGLKSNNPTSNDFKRHANTAVKFFSSV